MASGDIKTNELTFLQKFAEHYDIKVSPLTDETVYTQALFGGAAAGMLGAWYCVGTERLTESLKKQSPELIKALQAGIRDLLENLIFLSVEVILEKVLGDAELRKKIIEFLKCFLQMGKAAMSMLSAV